MGFHLTKPYAARPPSAILCTPENAYPRSQLQVSGRRFYSPNQSRWLSRDPIEEQGALQSGETVADASDLTLHDTGNHLYRFVQGNPINVTDYLGLECCCEGFVIMYTEGQGWLGEVAGEAYYFLGEIEIHTLISGTTASECFGILDEVSDIKTEREYKGKKQTIVDEKGRVKSGLLECGGVTTDRPKFKLDRPAINTPPKTPRIPRKSGAKWTYHWSITQHYTCVDSENEDTKAKHTFTFSGTYVDNF